MRTQTHDGRQARLVRQTSAIALLTRAAGAAATAALLLAAPVTQAATMIGVDFYGNGGSNHALASGDSAGVVPQANWNGNDTSGLLKNDAGVSTTVSITASSGGAGPFSLLSPATNNEKLMFDAYTGNKNTTTPVSVTLGGLNAAFPNGYYVIVYSWANSANKQHATLGATTYYMQNAVGFSGFVQATSTSSGSPTVGANYAQFGSDATPLTGNTFTLDILADSGGYRAPFNGFQIIGATPPATVPVLTAPTVASAADANATLGAAITSDGGASIASRGTVWNTTGDPVTENSLAEGGTSVSAFTHSRSSLAAGTLHYYRGYAVNSVGTGYSAPGTFHTEPGTQASDLGFGSMGSVSMQVTWTRGGGDGVIVVAKAGGAVTAPADGTVYTADAAFGGGTQIGASGTYVVYQGPDTSVDLTALQPTTTYYIGVYEYKGSGAASGGNYGINYRTSDGLTGSQSTSAGTVVPTLTAPTVAAGTVTETTATLGATLDANGGGTVTDYGVVWNTTGAPVTSDNLVQKGTTEPALPDTYTVDPSGLPAGTLVYYRGYAVNSAGAAYSPPGTFYTEPVTQASGVGFDTVTNNAMRMTWNRGNGDGVVVVVSAGSAPDADPADGTVYTADAAFGAGSPVGGGHVVYAGTGSAVDLTGLAEGTTYHAAVYEYKGSGAGTASDYGINYRQAAPATGSRATTVVLVLASTSFEGYTAGAELSGALPLATGDVGLSGTWSEGSAASAWTVVDKHLSYAVSGGATLSGGARAVGQAGTDNLKHFSMVNLASPIARTFYVRFLVLFESPLTVNAAVQVAIETTGDDYKYHTGGGLCHFANANNDAFISPATTSGTITSGAPDLTPGQAMLVVLRGNWDGAKFGSYDLWVNPPAAQPAANVTAAQSLMLNSVASLVVHGGVTGAGEPRTGLYIDDIKYCTTWAEALTPTPVVPAISAPTVTAVGTTTALLGATVGPDGGSAIAARGTLWDTNPSPTVNALAEGGSTTGTFVHARVGLPSGTRIHYRGYAVNATGTGYSPDGTFYTEPATQASGVSFSAISGTTMRVSWVAGDGAGRIVLVRQDGVVNAPPEDGVDSAYAANAAFGSGTQTGTGNHVVYKGAGTSVDVTGLLPAATYHVAVYEYAGSGDGPSGINYRQDAPATGSQTTVFEVLVPTVTAPTVTAAGAAMASLGATVTRDGGDSLTERGTVWDIHAAPTANPQAEGGLTTGVFAHVRAGLPPGTRIHYRGYAANSAGTGYSADDSFYTEPSTQASGVSVAAVTSTNMTVTWTPGSGDGRIVLVKEDGAVDAAPADGVDSGYTASSTFGNGTQVGSGNYVAYKGSGTSVTLTGLTEGTTYHVAVYEYAGGGDGTAGINYLQDGPAVGSQATAMPAYIVNWHGDYVSASQNFGRGKSQLLEGGTDRNGNGIGTDCIDYVAFDPASVPLSPAAGYVAPLGRSGRFYGGYSVYRSEHYGVVNSASVMDNGANDVIRLHTWDWTADDMIVWFRKADFPVFKHQWVFRAADTATLTTTMTFSRGTPRAVRMIVNDGGAYYVSQSALTANAESTTQTLTFAPAGVNWAVYSPASADGLVQRMSSQALTFDKPGTSFSDIRGVGIACELSSMSGGNGNDVVEVRISRFAITATGYFTGSVFVVR